MSVLTDNLVGVIKLLEARQLEDERGHAVFNNPDKAALLDILRASLKVVRNAPTIAPSGTGGVAGLALPLPYSVQWTGKKPKPEGAPAVARFWIPPTAGGSAWIEVGGGVRKRCRVVAVEPFDVSAEAEAAGDLLLEAP